MLFEKIAAKPYFLLLLILSLTGLYGCGGGSSSPSAEGTPPPAPSLTVSPTSLELDDSAVSAELQITSNSNWNITDDTGWLDVTPNSGQDNAQVTLAADSNPTESQRSATIEVKSGTLTRTVSVVQQAGVSNDMAYDVPPDTTGMREMSTLQFSQLLGSGINIGNSLEAINAQGEPEETAWGNLQINADLLRAIKEAGFDSIRLPVAWSKFTDAENFTIDPDWLDRIKTVVDMALDEGLLVIINNHWDGGWMQPTYEQQDYVNNRLASLWQQVGTYFRDYDDRLLFAGSNEVMVEGDFGTPTEEYYSVQNSFNQTFVNAVRKTGGRNVYRQLVVQGFNTNIDHSVQFLSIPDDVVAARLFVEVHYYDPFNFTLNENSNITQWGANTTDTELAEEWANESYVDSQFGRMKETFIDQGYAVILGEFGAIYRPEVEGHEAFREDWNRYIANSAREHGLVPYYWDNGAAGSNGMAIFDRSNGDLLFPGLLDAILAQ